MANLQSRRSRPWRKRGTRSRAPLYGACSVLIAVFAIAAARPAWTAGSNSGTPNPPPPVPTPVVTSSPALSSVNGGGCAQQYTSAINSNFDQAVVANETGLAAGATGAAAALVNYGAQVSLQAAAAASFTALSVGLAGTSAYGVAPAPTAGGVPFSADAAAAAGVLAGDSTAQSVANGTAAIGAAASVAGFAAQTTAVVFTKTGQNLADYASTLPNCEATFTGTVTAQQGVNVSGSSIFQGPVGFTQSINVGGSVTASQFFATQGISAFGGAITIGDPNLTTYSSGITLGGGALSGAGTGGLEAFTGDASAVAIGNNAAAMQVGSVALGVNAFAGGNSAIGIGNGAQAVGDSSLAVGNNAQALLLGSVALGVNSLADGNSAVAIGNGSQALADFSVAVGPGALIAAGAGAGSFAGGTSMVLGGTGAVSIGNLNMANGNGAVAIGDPNIAAGLGAAAIGADNFAAGQGAVAIGNSNTSIGQGAVALGDQNTATANAAIALGQGSAAAAAGAIALGQTADASAANAVAIGTNAWASGVGATVAGFLATASGDSSSAYGLGATATGTNSTAIGMGASAAAANSTAVGAGATVGAANTNSSAIGAGATTTASNQMVFGTASQTYTAPGIDSALSRARQSGPLGIVTTDAAGDLASDGGALYKEVAGIKAGAAVAMALSDPNLSGKEQFGVKMNWGAFDGANAVGLSMAGTVGYNMLMKGDRLTLSAAGGWGQATVTGYTSSEVGGRVSMQLSW